MTVCPVTVGLYINLTVWNKLISPYLLLLCFTGNLRRDLDTQPRPLPAEARILSYDSSHLSPTCHRLCIWSPP